MAAPAPETSPPERDPCGPPCDEAAVDWTKPPYRVGSVVTLLHAGEDPRSVSANERAARAHEYLRLLRAPGEPYFADALRRVREVFGSAENEDSKISPEEAEKATA